MTPRKLFCHLAVELPAYIEAWGTPNSTMQEETTSIGVAQR